MTTTSQEQPPEQPPVQEHDYTVEDAVLDFDPTIKNLILASHMLAQRKGWWDGEREHPRSLGDQFANFHAELSEAWEEYRSGYDLWKVYEQPIKQDDGSVMLKPCGFPTELADLCIRIFDTCGRYGIDLQAAILQKHRFNRTRPHRHGGKLA